MTILIAVLAVIIIIVLFKSGSSKGVNQVAAEEAGSIIKDAKAMLLDVRTQEEFHEGHIKGAKLIPVSEINDRLNELDSMKDRQILVYCRSGRRSNVASKILIKRGFTKVINLKGGIIAWVNAGNRVIKGT